jgi:hypothetical protein
MAILFQVHEKDIKQLKDILALRTSLYAKYYMHGRYLTRIDVFEFRPMEGEDESLRFLLFATDYSEFLRGCIRGLKKELSFNFSCIAV